MPMCHVISSNNCAGFARYLLDRSPEALVSLAQSSRLTLGNVALKASGIGTTFDWR